MSFALPFSPSIPNLNLTSLVPPLGLPGSTVPQLPPVPDLGALQQLVSQVKPPVPAIGDLGDIAHALPVGLPVELPGVPGAVAQTAVPTPGGLDVQDLPALLANVPTPVAIPTDLGAVQDALATLALPVPNAPELSAVQELLASVPGNIPGNLTVPNLPNVPELDGAQALIAALQSALPASSNAAAAPSDLSALNQLLASVPGAPKLPGIPNLGDLTSFAPSAPVLDVTPNGVHAQLDASPVGTGAVHVSAPAPISSVPSLEGLNLASLLTNLG